MRIDFDGFTNTFQEGCNANNHLHIGTCANHEVFALKEVHIYLDDERCLRAFLTIKDRDKPILDLYGVTRIKWHATKTFPPPSDQILQILIHALSPETHYEGYVEIDRVKGSP